MKSKYSKVVSIFVFIILTSIIVFFSYNTISNAVKSIIIQNIDELAEHDMQNIQEYVSGRWSDMISICNELKNEDTDNVKKLQDKLNIKTLAGRFSRLYMIDSNGRLYSDIYVTYEKDKNDFLQYFDTDKKKFVMRYDDNKRYSELKKEYLLYRLNLSDDPLTIADTEFIGMIALNDISEIQNKMRITSFNGKGYSSVINTNGYYIVNADTSSELNQIPNFFELIKDAEFEGNIDIDKIKDKIINKKNFEFTCTKANGEKKFVSIKYAMDANWYNWFFVYSLDTSVFTSQIYTFMAITMGIIISLIIMIAIIFFVLHLMRKKLKGYYSTMVENVYNRQYYNDKLVHENVKAFAMVDLDHLKHINDNYGHLAGDQSIEKTASVLCKNIGNFGCVVRYGGDEFAVAFKKSVSEDEFRTCLEHILNDIRETKLDAAPEANLTLSIGGCYHKGITGDLFKTAGRLLYEAKKARNCVVISSKLTEEK